MGEQSYVGQSHLLQQANNMPEGPRAPIAQPVTTYQDLAPYSAVSSFNLPNQCDASLLTPISTAASPPLHQAPKFSRQYAPGTPQQEPTPPGTSRMYQWQNQFDMPGQASHNGSPIPNQANPAHEYGDPPSMADGRRTPNPPELYMGAYAVSDGSDYHGMPHQSAPYYMPQVQQGAMIDQPMPLEIRGDMNRHHQSTAPMLNQPHPSQYRQERRVSEDIPEYHRSGQARLANGSPRRRVAQGGPRVRKRATKRKVQARSGSHAADPADEHKNCLGEEVPPRLKESCPQEERFIFESRWKYRTQKGQDMWDNIQKDFEKRFQKQHGKEMLQMKFKRGRSKYIEWLPDDEKILREAWEKVEADRYQTILDKFIELRGSRNMRLSASDIEVKLVNDLKLEENVFMESFGDIGIRRRRKLNARKRVGGRGHDEAESLNDEITSVSSHNTHEDDVINQVHGLRENFDHDSTMSPELIDNQMLKREQVPRYVDYSRQTQDLRFTTGHGGYGRQRV